MGLDQQAAPAANLLEHAALSSSARVAVPPARPGGLPMRSIRLPIFVIASIIVPSILLGQVSFQQQSYPTNYFSRIQRADFNNDGVPDVLLYNGSNNSLTGFAVVLNDGHGAFGAPIDSMLGGPAL